jgi:mRNA interferase YafQ
MRQIKFSTAFKKDKKRCQKRQYDFAKLQEVIDLLLAGKPLAESKKPHKLIGNYEGRWECHLEPDWLLIYSVTDDEVFLARMGTHSDLF